MTFTISPKTTDPDELEDNTDEHFDRIGFKHLSIDVERICNRHERLVSSYRAFSRRPTLRLTFAGHMLFSSSSLGVVLLSSSCIIPHSVFIKDTSFSVGPLLCTSHRSVDHSASDLRILR